MSETVELRTVNLILPMPPSSNRYWRMDKRGFNYLSDEAKRYKRQVAEMADLANPIISEISVSVKVFRPQRSGDLDNRLKVFLDSLQGVVYANDSQVVEIHAYRYEDAKRPRIEVSIQVLGLF